MICRTLLLSVAFALALAACAVAADAPAAEAAKPEAAPAEKPAAGEAAKEPVLEGEALTLAREAKLDDAQQKKLAKTDADIRGEIQAWETANADKLKAFMEARQQAVQDNNQAAYQKVMQDAQPLLAPYTAILAKHRQAVQDLLTPEQKNLWQGYMLSQQVMDDLGPLGLADEQKTKIRGLCGEASKQLSAVEGQDAAAMQKRQAVLSQLGQTIVGTILTAEQKARIQPPAAMQPAGAEAAPPAETKPEAKAAEKAAEKPAEPKAETKPEPKG
jgi:putative methionine-R-sulfoxide reductase with GAF domain